MPRQPETANNGGPAFRTTHWTQVMRARGDSPQAQAALGELCAAYYEPVQAFIKHSIRDEESASDLTQEFFARLLSQSGIGHANPELGRFRSFLLGAVKHFLSASRARAQRQKRGSGQPMESLDRETSSGSNTTTSFQVADPNTPNPEREFDRKWALTLLARALLTLELEHEAAGKHDQFQTLKPWLTGDTEAISQAQTAASLGVNEGALKVAIHRLRRRFRQVIKEEISQTVEDPAQVENELHCLFEALM